MKHTGNPKTCECHACVVLRVKDHLAKIHDTSRLIPDNIHQTVAVRAHWRRHPGHLKKMPETRKYLHEQLKKMMEKS
jgi:hypothetical protein